MRRRDLLAMLGGGAATWPLAARAQSQPARRIGVLMNGSEAQSVARNALTTFIDALGKLGWTGDRKLQIDVRWAGDDRAGFDRGAAELVALAPEAILASTTPALTSLRERTGKIPIVFVTVTDPVGQGFVTSLARPGGTITGFSNYDPPMTGKWLGLLKEIVPRMVLAAPLYNPRTAPYAPLMLRSLQANAAALGVTIEPAPVQSTDDIDRAIAALGDKPQNGLIVLPDGFTTSHRDRIIGPATRHGVPAIYPYSYYAREGGLISYGIVIADLYRRGADYIDRILRGAKPSDLPVQAPTKFELALNLKAAKALGLSVPLTLQGTADEVIE